MVARWSVGHPAFAAVSFLLWLFILPPPLVSADNVTQPISIFRSRPDLVSPIVTIHERDPDRVTPGYFFISPYQQIQETPHIYDNDGNLVWSGFGAAGPGVSHAPQVCNYRGEPHLCFYQGTQLVGWGHGHGIIMDKHYRIVRSVEAGSYQGASDMHEFMLLPDGKSALMTQYLRSAADLCQWEICNGLGYIQQGAFQEVDVESGEVLFEWRSLDHIDATESYVPPGTTEISGNGRDIGLPWDYFHINSVDKNAHGDYLISARHTSGIYKISGKDGHVMWRLNGARSDFRLKNFESAYGFSFQHDARFVAEDETTTTISLFDNGSNGYNYTRDISTGMLVVLDHEEMTATMIKNYSSPLYDGQHHTSRSQGNTQLLPNGNVLVGWGNNAFWSEHLEDGTPVWYGSIGSTNVMNYRAHKFNWTGLPLTRPAIWTYSKTATHQEGMMVYVSWNGATEVRKWSIFTGPTAKGPWHLVTTIAKNGFETIWHNDVFAHYTYAAALDKDGKTLGKSDVQETFVPSAELRPNCDELACFSSVLDEEAEIRLQEAKEAEERLRLEEEEKQRLLEAEALRKRNASTLWGICGFVSVLVLLLARRVIMRPLTALTYYVYDVAAFALRRAKSGKGRYKAISGSERAGFDTPDSGTALEPS